MSEEKKLVNAADAERAASQETRSSKPQKPVYVYLIAMFAVALLLMSLSFMMSHRSNQEVMGELKENVNSFQLLQESEERNAELLQRINSLEDEVAAQRDTIFELQQEINSLQKQLVEAKQQIPQTEEQVEEQTQE